MLMLRGLRQIECESVVVLLLTCLRAARYQSAGRGVSCNVPLGGTLHGGAQAFFSPIKRVAPAIENPADQSDEKAAHRLAWPLWLASWGLSGSRSR